MSDSYGSGLDFGPGVAPAPITPMDDSPPTASPQDSAPAVAAPAAAPPQSEGFGSTLRSILPGPNYKTDPQLAPLDQTADLLQQRINRANSVATNPLAQFFAPDRVQAAREFVPKATEELLKMQQQKSAIQSGRVQADTLGLSPGDVSDQASQDDRLTVATSKALKGDMRAFQGLSAVAPERAAAIAPQVHEVVSGHLDKAQLAFDSLAGMQNQGQYNAKLQQLRQDGTLTDLEALGMKVPATFDAFNNTKAAEGKALREARIGIESTRQKLEERNTYQPMEEKEAKTYNGRLTTVYGDQVTNGTWGRNGASGTRGLIVNGAADPNDLGKKFTLATPDQRKAVKEEFDGAASKQDIEKYRAFNRTYTLATTDAKGNQIADGKINTNPNVQQGVSEGLASMLRGGQGGANVGLLKIELGKRGWAQSAIDGLVTNYAGTVNSLFANADKPYLSQQTQKQIRDVMDVLKTYNDSSIADRATDVAKRAGALGLDTAALGLGKDEATGVIGNALEAGRQEQIERMKPNHQAIGGGDGVLQLGAQRTGVNASNLPAGTTNVNQLPGQPPILTPVQQAQQPQQAAPPNTGGPALRGQPAPQQPTSGAGAPVTVAGQPPGRGFIQPVQQSDLPPINPTGGAPSAPVVVAGQQVSAPQLPQGASPSYMQAAQRIESGGTRNPWTATAGSTSASGAFQFIKSTWNDNKPAGAPDRAADATPEQQKQAFENFTAKNAASLTRAGLPVNDTSLYITHNLGAAGGSKLMAADPSADARTVVGEVAARNNPKFFRGRPTVATAMQRYADAVNAEPSNGQPKPTMVAQNAAPGAVVNDGGPQFGSAFAPAAPASADNTELLAAGQTGGMPAGRGEMSPEDKKQVVDNLAGAAPAALSTAGAIGGGLLGGPPGAIVGGAGGGGAGQALKDYLRGNKQSPLEITKQAALGGVLGVMSPARPIAAAAARVVGSGAVEASADAAEHGLTPDTLDAGARGAIEGVAGEAFGRALGMAGHKVFSLFAPDAKAAVQSAAKTYSEASEALRTEAPKLPGVGGAAGTANPKYEAAQAAKEKAEATLKDAGVKPDEAAYAYKVSSERVPLGEAQVGRPGAAEKADIGTGYQQLESEIGAGTRGQKDIKAAPKLADGPIAAVDAGKVSKAHTELAQHVEAAITAPAGNWQHKWTQLKDARSDLLQAERDALTSTATGRTKTADDMRKLADTVRAQQEKVAQYVFGPEAGNAFMGRLRMLDTRYRNLMEATNGGDLIKAAGMKGEAGREADRKFRAFAHDDPEALQAWSAMRRTGPDVEKDVKHLVAFERIPVLGKMYSAAKLAGSFNSWMRERAAGNPATFKDFINAGDNGARATRDVVGTAVQRGAVQGDVLNSQPGQ